MNKEDLSKSETYDTAHILQIMPIEELQSIAKDFSLDQLATILLLLKQSSTIHSYERLRALVEGIDDKKKLELIGKLLDLPFITALLDSETPDGLQTKLSPILVGMPHSVFSALLDSATSAHCEILKHECNSEALLHHLTVISHELEGLVQTYANTLESLSEEIAKLSPKELSRAELTMLNKKITELSNNYENLINKISKILLITWNTNRTDLLEKMSNLKESTTKTLLTRIGKPRTHFGEPTGLYQEIETSLNTIFGNPDDVKDIEALRDEEPAVEALAKFSIWYLQDYWELGLLSSIKKKDDLDLNPDEYPFEERQAHQKKLFEEAETNLSAIGLKTVKDLKRQGIFSKKTLREYIEKDK